MWITPIADTQGLPYLFVVFTSARRLARSVLIRATIEQDSKLGEGNMPPTLFSYCIPYDDGAAPNPFWGLCTLAICKPAIRRVAKKDDWVVGTGSVDSPIGNTSGKVVYAMRVTEKMVMRAYDQFTLSELPNKIPQMDHTDRRRWYGDSIYDFSSSIFPPPLRPSVHSEGNRSTDASGRFVLLSNHFFYFGDHPVALPEELLGIVKQGQGHRSDKNSEYVGVFIDWIESLTPKYPLNEPIGNPQWWSKQDVQASCSPCAIGRQQEVDADQAEPDAPCNNPC
jgi:hypothetical protein